jgi:hypothetical protein
MPGAWKSRRRVILLLLGLGKELKRSK